jgi:hypothetical protein
MLQIVKTDAGGLEATLYRIDQSGEPEFIPSVNLSGAELRLSLHDGETYDGSVNDGASEIHGFWRKGQEARQPLDFQRVTKQTAWEDLDSDVAPQVTAQDLEIVEHAQQLLSAPERWNRADTRECPKTAERYSIYCAFDRATVEVMGRFQHRGGTMQEARLVIDDSLAKGNHYEHRLMDYNNDPKTTFVDIQEFFRLLKVRIREKLNVASDTRP